MSNIGDYESKVAEVEKIIDEIESGRLPLEEVFEKFAIAVQGLKQCESILTEGQKRMNLSIESLNIEDSEEF
ncbi:MAG: Exodeoxyribonuclease 7 small subunit [Chroococcopsis gigantea SAG 12.99]|jgi:exodeoxyribonuclease VII small subunit|nr:exodeoxyribonuclease VII small subunit [Chlorogloea purpurea SAG 13.99]MDV3001507.1 Exodeoxyribonuclease 7 small subunit [Chroococcopsis gigantea SAG 12.99]